MQSVAPQLTRTIQCALYLRISSDRRGLSLGVERQEEACRALAAQLGWEIYTVLSENDLSAYSGKPRPLYRQLLDLMESGTVHAVIALHTDRLHRSPTELEEFIDICERGRIEVRTVQAGELDLTSATGRMAARIYGAVARHEVEHAIERQKAAKAQAAKSGKPSGGNRAYGWQQNGFDLNHDEAPIVKEIVHRFIDGHSWNSIALDLNARGILTAKGHMWTAVNARNVATLPRHYGIRTHNDQEYPAAWEPLLSTDTWEELQKAIKRGQAVYGSRTHARKHLLTGFVFCGLCGTRMNVMSARQRDGCYSPAFACRKMDHRGQEVGCGKVKRKKDPVETLVVESVLYRLNSPDLGAMLDGASATSTFKETLQEHDQQALRLQEILDLYSTGEIDFAEYKAAKAGAQKRLNQLSHELDRMRSKAAFANLSPGQTVQEAWERGDLEWRRRVLDALIEKVLIHPKQAGDQKMRYRGFIFNPERVEIRWKA